MLPENIRDLDESEMIVFPVGSKEDESPITRPTSSRDDGTQIHITSVEHYFEHCLSWLENPGWKCAPNGANGTMRPGDRGKYGIIGNVESATCG